VREVEKYFFFFLLLQLSVESGEDGRVLFLEVILDESWRGWVSTHFFFRFPDMKDLSQSMW
jgi:hypothetical protein